MVLKLLRTLSLLAFCNFSMSVDLLQFALSCRRVRNHSILWTARYSNHRLFSTPASITDWEMDICWSSPNLQYEKDTYTLVSVCWLTEMRLLTIDLCMFASVLFICSSGARSRHFDGARPKSRHGEPGHEELLFKTLGQIQKLCDEWQVAMSDVAIAYLRAQVRWIGRVCSVNQSIEFVVGYGKMFVLSVGVLLL